MDNSRQQLIKQFHEWIDFVKSLHEQDERIWDKQVGEGKWSIREIIAHMMLWDKYFLEEAIDKIHTLSPVTVQHFNFDEFNQHAKTYGKNTESHTLEEQAIFYREEIIQRIHSFPDDIYSVDYLDGDGNTFNVEQYLKDFIGHDHHHVTQMKNIINSL
jgi:hypothetical protein